MLKWAREQIGLEVDQAANLVKGLSAEKIRAWESGEDVPTLEDLETLGELYDCPVGYFFLDSPPQEEAPILDYRGVAPEKLQNLSYESRRQLRRFTRLADLAASLIASIGLNWEVSLPDQGSVYPIEVSAAKVVETLGITYSELSNLPDDQSAHDLWRAKIEQQGVLVFSFRLDPGELRGASLRTPQGPPSILVNHADVEAASGRTFTLLHEYAHLLVRQPSMVCDFRGQPVLEEVEHFANRFAAEALVPRAEFESPLASEKLNGYKEHWSNPVIEHLRRPFHVSQDVIRVMLQELSYAPQNSYSQWRINVERRKPWGRSTRGGQTMQARRQRELGANFPRILSYAYRQSAISRLDLAGILDMKIERAEEFLAGFLNEVTR